MENNTNTINQSNSASVINAENPQKEQARTGKLKQIYAKLDTKLTKLLPEPKMRKVMIFTLGGMLLFFSLIIILGIIVSIGRPRENLGYYLNKPKIMQGSPQPEKTRTVTQSNLLNLRDELNKLNFPSPELTAPQIETDINLNTEK